MNAGRKGAAALSIAAVVAASVVIHFARADADDKPTSQASTAPIATTTTAAPTDASGTATVTTAPLRDGEISQSITAYGSVTAQPGAIAIFSVPYECRVVRLLIAAGQPVDGNTALIQVEPSPNAKLALAEAQSNLESATKDLQQTQQRFDMKLGTSSDLLQSQQAMKLAQLRLDSLKQQGAGEDRKTLNAAATGLIARVDVQQGQIVPAGNPLVETISRDQVEVRLGVDPERINLLANGQAVQLFPSTGNSTEPITGRIRLITQRVNPDTRLVDVFVAPDSRESLLLDGFVRGEILNNAKASLIAPHNAVLPDDEGLLVYSIKDGKAVKHVVTTGAHNDDEVAVISNDLHTGERVVVQGNLELEDGMAVVEDKPAQSGDDASQSQHSGDNK
jgi:RND family efflux transporter MFP subunit